MENSLLNGNRSNGLNGVRNRRNEIRILPEKEFMARPSLYTKLFKVKEFQTIHNMFLALLINLTLYQMIYEYLEYGRIDLGFSNLSTVFGNPKVTILAVLSFNLVHVVFYPSFKLWVTVRNEMNKDSKKTFDKIFIFFFMMLEIKLLLTPWSINLNGTGCASRAIIIMENLRIVLKLYVFVRSNFNKITQGVILNEESKETQEPQNYVNDSNKNHINGNGITLRKIETKSEINLNGTSHLKEPIKMKFTPQFSKYIYYMYAPTFVYRDSYPRTNEIRWKIVFYNLLDVLGSILLYNFIQDKFGHNQFKDFGLKGHEMNLKGIVQGFFPIMISGYSAFHLVGFFFNHCWPNAFAELLTFADREFYKDHWNSKSFSELFLNITGIIQDFIYAYVYKEIKETSFGSKHKFLSSYITMFLSALVHEYIICYALQFSYPAMMLFFIGPGAFFSFIPNKNYPKLGNLFVHWCLMFGSGLVLALYQMEHSARVNNCLPSDPNRSPVVDFFTPRTFTCDAFKW